jgi:hypothetical protein
MPEAAAVAKLVRQAALWLRTGKGRAGNIQPIDGEDVLVAGDLHGHVPNYKRLVALADLPNHPQRHLVLQEFVHGPGRYANGGDTSHQVLDLACALKCTHPSQVHLLPGNHELSELTGRAITKNGVALNELFAEGLATQYGEEGAADVYDAYHELIRSMPLAVRTSNRILCVHTVPSAKSLETFDVAVFQRFGLPLEAAERGGSLYAVLWDRDLTEETTQRFAELMGVDWLVTGHVPQEAGFDRPNARRLIVDCCGEPAAYVLLPISRPITGDEFAAGVHYLPLD